MNTTRLTARFSNNDADHRLMVTTMLEHLVSHAGVLITSLREDIEVDTEYHRQMIANLTAALQPELKRITADKVEAGSAVQTGSLFDLK